MGTTCDDSSEAVTSESRILSEKAVDLRMGVASFCKAFPWHFVVDRQLEIVQLGVGFMRIFGHNLNRLGREISTYFVFTRPRGVTLTFHEILKRANTPFVLALQKPPGADKFPAEVSRYRLFRLRTIMMLDYRHYFGMPRNVLALKLTRFIFYQLFFFN